MGHEGDGDTNCNWCAPNNPQIFVKVTGGHGNKKTSGDHLDSSVIKIGREEYWRLGEICCHLSPCEKRSANAGVKNSQRSKIITPKKTCHSDSSERPLANTDVKNS